MLLHSSSKKEKNPPTCPDFDQARGFFAHFAIMNRRTGRGAEPEPRPQAGGRGGAGPRPERTERREAGPRPQAGGKGDARPGLGHRPAGKATRSRASAGTRARKRTPPPPGAGGPIGAGADSGRGRKEADSAGRQLSASGHLARLDCRGPCWAAARTAPRTSRASGAGIRVGGPTRDVNQHRAQDRRRRQRQHRA